MTQQSESIAQLMPAYLAAQAAFKPAVKDAQNPHFGSSFVSLGGVLGAVTEALRENELAVLQLTDVEPDGRTVLLTRLVHVSGEWIGGRYPVNPVKNDPQAYGSALTYARRYGLMALLGVVAEDDDGHAASQPAPAPVKRAPKNAKREALRAEIFTAGNANGLATWSDIASDFASWSMGEVMGEASDEQLTKYRDYLRTAVTA